MMSEGSVTNWIQMLGDGDESVAQSELFDRYFTKLIALARQRLRSCPRTSEGEEDAALSAMDSFFQRARDGAFPDLRNRSELWALLVTITTRKAINQFKRQTAARRQPNRHGTVDDHGAMVRLDELTSGEPTPEMVLELSEECNRRLDALGDDVLRRVALMKLEGYSNLEISVELNVAERTVGRKLNRIRQEWMQQETNTH